MDLQLILPKVLLTLGAFALMLNLVVHYSKGTCAGWKAFNVMAAIVLVLFSGSVIGLLAVSRMDLDKFIQFTDSKGWNFFLGIITMMLLTFIQFRLFQYVVAWIDSRSSRHCDLRLTLYAVFVPLIVGMLKTLLTSGYHFFPKDFWAALTFGAGFWEFLVALSLVLSAILIVIQLAEFVVALRRHLPFLILLLSIYAITFVSFIFLAVYAAMGLLLLFAIYVVCKIVAACLAPDKVVMEIRGRKER